MQELLEYDVTITKKGHFTIMAYDLSDAQERVSAIEENWELEKYVTDWEESEVVDIS
jgi:hypothetical protein